MKFSVGDKVVYEDAFIPGLCKQGKIVYEDHVRLIVDGPLGIREEVKLHSKTIVAYSKREFYIAVATRDNNKIADLKKEIAYYETRVTALYTLAEEES